MKKRLRTAGLIPALVLLTWVTAAVSPAAYSIYRCHAMAATFVAPCCANMAATTVAPQRTDISDVAQLRAERCCSREAVSLERAPSELNGRHSDDSVQRLSMANAVAVAVTPAAPPLAIDFARFVAKRVSEAAGPPVLQQTCSLLI